MIAYIPLNKETPVNNKDKDILKSVSGGIT
jgi:hypothetical protein